MRTAAALCVALAGCAYHPGSFNQVGHPFSGEHLTEGCLDVSIERRPELPRGGTVIGYEFGNRCDRPAVVDLAAVGIVGRTADGREVDLVAFDPKHELKALQLDGRSVGSEAIAYPSRVPFVEICVDAASIAHAAPAQWVCMGSKWLPQQQTIATREAP